MTHGKALVLAVAATLSYGCTRAPRSNETTDANDANDAPNPRVASAPVAMQGAGDSITLERTPCYGTCPVYRVTLQGGGDVRFEGIRNVDSMGVRTWRVSADSAGAVFRFADSISVLTLADRYAYGAPGCSPYIADFPGAVVTLTRSGKTKRVETDPGCPNVPSQMVTLQRLIDRTVRIERAVGKR